MTTAGSFSFMVLRTQESNSVPGTRQVCDCCANVLSQCWCLLARPPAPSSETSLGLGVLARSPWPQLPASGAATQHLWPIDLPAPRHSFKREPLAQERVGQGAEPQAGPKPQHRPQPAPRCLSASHPPELTQADANESPGETSIKILLRNHLVSSGNSRQKEFQGQLLEP